MLSTHHTPLSARLASSCCVVSAGAFLATLSCSTAPTPSAGSQASGGSSSGGSSGAPAGGSPEGAFSGSSASLAAGSAGVSSAGGFAGGAGGNSASGASSSGAGGDVSAPTLHMWPQAGGPEGTFRANVPGAPTTWSVAAHQNILWQTNLDNEGQGGVAVAANLLFLTTFLPFTGSKNSLSIEGYAIDRTTGAIKWRTKPLTGNGESSGMAYQYSDATSWTPITDGKYVWFFNSAGHMGCWDTAGIPDASGILAPVWEADFAGQDPAFPFNRQHEPFMIGSDLVILSPLGMGKGDPTPKHVGWNYLHGIDKLTGKTTWVADDASTFYNTAVIGILPNGMLAVLHGRGGEHGVPETPVGLSMTSLAPGSLGKSLWQYNSAAGTALYTMSWDEKYAYWFTVPPSEMLDVLDAATGKPLHAWSLSKLADIRRWDTATSKYVSMSGVNLNNTADWEYAGTMHVVPDWHSNIVANGYMWFLAVANNNDRWGTHTGPPHCVGRVNVETGKVEYLELPVGAQRSPSTAELLVYGKDLTTTAMDAKGNDVAEDVPRSHTDGWSIPAFFASPILLGNKLYFGTTLGITYVIDATAKVLDEHAILGIGDLGTLGQTWSLAGPSFADGVLYHHSSKAVVAIGSQP